ncbi:tRNA (adenosine(37)-N6)-threonylcarbamoyltransferase complex dimerization subunit type 1 TsaB [Gordonia sp. HNM0687]|uniref:tRNA (Adenosine(37)-N6)-threonylcarbamoyltransferase complex dimerization subunit type 1 TsaB n=1 Tax=Gordonia mangrovi TaxID=2665643 RepID=A0A6L7GWN7_9ACTN|nr:tRNA (adenosine(37)-N6)-threonylcarbamoyltransferase complex dimerization subunit type 1 TsaB [Gordonia mangrovi]MDY6807670.1 tRNA (adenosine(37)-N6)-threonylcarbamoyltransferase complex dimerization subunit type 1 TsaB [Actinomycetota bacterium]MXP23035.1 tRNA (adenosine(37)-N6)-threonylcarbamoyltransferase complex dimerization subunit type 1 TsaB [Gordonia mangrovi]UVF77324.1 tRNA (adenosine(37)-N6)-threonylcarbamoyltransferase complex dimerization subunit type 1 TsaB [Gordonia mangrovi]
MDVLAIDTSTDAVVAGVAAVHAADGVPEVLAEQRVTDGRRHAEVLTSLIEEGLQAAAVTRGDLDAVVVGCGPGPFTGLRVGMATAAAFGDALGLPVYGVCSLDAIAAQERSVAVAASSLLVVTDARRREIYWATYDKGARTAGPAVGAPGDVVADLTDVPIDVVVGSPAHTDLFDRPVGTASVPTVAGLVTAAHADLRDGAPSAALVPLYLRRPDAVEPKRRRPAGPQHQEVAR